jgi:polyisoprenoid-binding protein YceI
LILRRVLIACFVLLGGATAFSQGKYTVQKSDMSFTSKAELELIKASSTETQGIIDPATNQFAFSVPISSFRGFNSDLQRQHFNDNYMESSKYGKASFTGKIIEQVNYAHDSVYTVRAKGELDIHGQKQTRIIKAKLIVRKNDLQIDTDFNVPLTDHNISIPRIVSQKIATEIDVRFRATLVH